MSTTNSLYVASKTYTNLPTSSLFVSQRHVVGVRHLEFTYLFQLMFRPMETKGHEDVEYALSVVGCSPMATQRVYHSLLRPPTLQPLLRCSSYHDSSAPTCWNELQAFESKRRSCAEKFVGKYGVTYWGAETRKMYLLPEAFKEPESLCTYPERKEE
ncbi:unnamed protein product [Aspergillus oryzae RIB40]|uniref:DNA, SC005 n=2 Tax=Aspergillus oryzae TaxID=5062 RepID=Q2URN5_ASPOR|nr:unnamed protein product [Aspergillus oryzae RIB40]EIT74057.1 hypothetical protein Ao3042_09889 [Aspergillus oryzae 3.042]KDE82242.1 hypothetical protein AO1008_08737 [Aspergillus oryzae 100-8]BAE55780.1 unnamed protein product [Aspergillus oryzae RIB40]|eukprot:EIT74057.1 hypothetical protein Ao3042_09889 [Aspergillus oryzae 3.042]